MRENFVWDASFRRWQWPWSVGITTETRHQRLSYKVRMVVKGVVVESPDTRKLVEAVHFRSVIVFMVMQQPSSRLCAMPRLQSEELASLARWHPVTAGSMRRVRRWGVCFRPRLVCKDSCVHAIRCCRCYRCYVHTWSSTEIFLLAGADASALTFPGCPVCRDGQKCFEAQYTWQEKEINERFDIIQGVVR